MLLHNCANVTAHLGTHCRTITHMLSQQKHEHTAAKLCTRCSKIMQALQHNYSHVAAQQHTVTKQRKLEHMLQQHKLQHMSRFNNPHIKAQQRTCQSPAGHMSKLN